MVLNAGYVDNVADMKKLIVFHNKSPRRICKTYWPDIKSVLSGWDMC